MPHREKADRDEIARMYGLTGSGRKTAELLGLHPNTVYQALRTEHGKCRQCANPVVIGRVYCQSCLDAIKERQRRKRKERTRAGICQMCDKPRDPLSRQFCTEHRLQHLDRNDRYEERQRVARAVAGTLPSQEWRHWHLLKNYGQGAVNVWERLQGACVLCGITHAERAVHVHHIDGDYSNTAESNFTLLCQHCHRLVHSVIEHPNPPFALAWIRATYPHLGL